MLKKISIILSIVAAFGLVLTAPVSADAKPKKKTVVVVTPKKKVVVVHKKPVTVYVIGKSYNGHLYVGKKRHRWHDKWYAYGVGPCWIKVGGLWFWNVAACP
jgi:hypothetical protein